MIRCRGIRKYLCMKRIRKQRKCVCFVILQICHLHIFWGYLELGQSAWWVRRERKSETIRVDRIAFSTDLVMNLEKLMITMVRVITKTMQSWDDLKKSLSYLLMMTSSNGNIFALLAICAGNSLVTGEFPAQRPGTRSFDVFFDLHLNIRLSKQLWGWWFETPSRPLWRHCNAWR